MASNSHHLWPIGMNVKNPAADGVLQIEMSELQDQLGRYDGTEH